MGTFAARTAVNAGSSVHLAAIAVAAKAKKLAAGMMECVWETTWSSPAATCV